MMYLGTTDAFEFAAATADSAEILAFLSAVFDRCKYRFRLSTGYALKEALASQPSMATELNTRQNGSDTIT